MRPDRHTENQAARPPLAGSVGVGNRTRGRQASPHASKFFMATSVLATIGVCAGILAIFIAINSENGGPPPAWSSWQPQDSGLAGAREIADHFAPFYRIDGADQLDAITVLNVANPATVANSSTGTPPNQIQVALKAEGATANQSAVSLLGGRTVAYNLCGLGTPNCSIGQGTPSSGRLLLLRREALELALYTFKYLPQFENVVAVLPSGFTQESSTLSTTPPNPTATTANAGSVPLDLAVLFDREELQPFTQQPVTNTLPLKYPPSVAELTLWKQTEDAAAVDELTSRSLFSDQFEHSADGSYLLVLQPQAPQ